MINSNGKKNYVAVGVGGRSNMYLSGLAEKYKESSTLSAICDKNEGRLQLAYNRLKSSFDVLEKYDSKDFDKMLSRHKPDCVIVCTVDSLHDYYICKALDAGCDVITEKPMTTDEKKCQRIIDTVKKTDGDVRVTFNYRYSPPRTQVKELLMDDVIGKVLSVEFQWQLDTCHGADYFRRWHRNKANSGGLMVHKATHHFDLVNWWLSSAPKTVFAGGDRVFYTEKQAKRYGLEEHGERCLNCPVSDRCNFYLDMSNYDVMKALYLDQEEYDGYFRDRCVFSDEIDIEDTMNVVVNYESGAYLSYSLNAFSPWEGYQVAFNGTKGRLEQVCRESSYISGDGSVQGAFQSEETSIKVFPHFKTPYQIPVKEGKGAHGGGDKVLLEDIFGSPGTDPLKRAADYVQGAYSILVGVAANKSMVDDKIVRIDDLVEGLGKPNYPKMPSGEGRIPYVPGAVRMKDGKKSMANVSSRIDAPE